MTRIGPVLLLVVAVVYLAYRAGTADGPAEVVTWATLAAGAIGLVVMGFLEPRSRAFAVAVGVTLVLLVTSFVAGWVATLGS